MACYYPLTQYRSAKNDGSYTFNPKEAHRHSQRQISCGQCWGCQLEYSRMWATRCMHEAQMHPDHTNHFLTLTLNDENLPDNNSLHKPHLINFWKRLRKEGYKFKYYACGEYGDEYHRPHYHAIIFGLVIPDKKHHSNRNGNNLYTSKTIEGLWTHGHVTIGNVTFESCAYVSRYINKRQAKKIGHFEYEIIDSQTGEILDHLEPEYSAMSKGIGESYYDKYKSDMYQPGTDGTCIIRGDIKTKTPLYYDNKFKAEKKNKKRVEQIQKRRQDKAKLLKPENTRERLIIKEKLALTIINKKLPRTFKGVENEINIHSIR